MPDAQQLLLFMAAGLLLNLTPGPDVLYIVTQSLRSGARAGMVAALGINAGCLVHIVAAALGVGALLAASATAFTLLKWAGAAYLLWMGVRLLLARAPRQVADLRALAGAQPRADLWAVFRGGFLTNVLNPKVAVFFLAFVPQFIAPEAAHPARAFLLLGALFNVNSVAVNVGWALAAAWMARHDAVQRGMQGLDRIAGAMFIVFGARLALADNPSR
ncbi:LysE family translocator [Ramlibacter tataouinensis]|uniref:Candidate threonine efflux protein n=1 Tax=Ramlibacter tataouinensis (strain ATCC BAA-407 / DSM 14655 / LMG 21543 / TTB310) TaxID=365046 RepID=F5Y0V2_RAMTT|nr:LysE family translocator [Ramlibacter tataouinensis]AEG94696.1 Candidate threonine efflux protein [Ramlibacter tataouinensis TTB310]